MYIPLCVSQTAVRHTNFQSHCVHRTCCCECVDHNHTQARSALIQQFKETAVHDGRKINKFTWNRHSPWRWVHRARCWYLYGRSSTCPFMQGPTPSAFLERHINLCSPTRHLCAVHLYSGMSHSNSVHNRVHTSPLLDPILIRVNPTHIVTPYFLEVNFNIILPSIISLPSDMCSSGTAVKILISSHPSLRATRSSPSLSLGDIPESCFYSSRVPFQYI